METIVNFFPLLLLIKAFEMVHSPPTRYVVLKAFTENKIVYISKRPLGAGSARNMWLKQTLKA